LNTKATVILTGNPNCGKTTVFNALTGLRAKVGNYAGVTVERKEGWLVGATPRPTVLLDLPGAYSLSPQSLDEQVAHDVLFQRLADVPRPDLVVVVVDASNLERNLYYATQVIELGYPVVIALNMIDVARENGHDIMASQLADQLGVPVVPLIASRGEGIPRLRAAIFHQLSLDPSTASPNARVFGDLPPAFRQEARTIEQALEPLLPGPKTTLRAQSILLLSDERSLLSPDSACAESLRPLVTAARQRLTDAGLEWHSLAIESRYARLAEICQASTTVLPVAQETFSDRLDRVVTHKVWGLLIFVVLMALMFQGIFTFAKWPMYALTFVVDSTGHAVSWLIPPGDLHSLVEDGVVAGVGAVLVFLPQICLLFLFLGLLEDTGYMARAAFLMDHYMSKVGLHGKSFIPLLSSFACAVPGIMATRTIEGQKDRLVTILVAPLMSCSARLPVYTLLIGACIADRPVLGLLRLQGLTMFAMYMLGIVAAILIAWLLKKTILRGPRPLLIMELPPYRRPLARVLARHVWDRAGIFLRQAGTYILAMNIVLWFLATYPSKPAIEKEFAERRQTLLATVNSVAPDDAALTPEARNNVQALEHLKSSQILSRSFAGRLGHLLEPVIAPLGFDWRIGIGIISSFAARETFVSTMSTVYHVGQGAHERPAEAVNMIQTMKEQKRPDGSPVYTPLTGLALMVFYVFALQCVSTIVVVRRETGTWKWPAFQWAYLGLLAWFFSFAVYQGGRWLGWQ
jgi:ferrous iron transport protein B